MKIFTTAKDEFAAFQRFFAGHSFERLPKEYKGIDIDLLLFPGGADVHPKRYGGKIPRESMFGQWIDEERDEWEFQVFRDVISGALKPKKVLGICRGVQFLNVAMSGSLTYDIQSRYGHPHPNVHPIKWSVKNVFSSVDVVNSIHHQAIYSIGDNFSYAVLGVEPSTGIVEAILWRDRYLGMQFHPELWGNLEQMKVFSKGILDWVEGKNEIVLRELDSENTVKSTGYKAYKYAFASAVSDAKVKEQEKDLMKFLTSWDNTPEIEIESDVEDEYEDEDDPDED